MAKTASFGLLHLATAFSICYAMTGSLSVSGAITVLEPLANTVMHYFHDRHWPAVEAWWRTRRSPQHSVANATREHAPCTT